MGKLTQGIIFFIKRFTVDGSPVAKRFWYTLRVLFYLSCTSYTVLIFLNVL